VTSALKLTAQPDLLISNTLRLHPTAIIAANSTHGTAFDMGQNMVGNIALHLSGPRGSVVLIRYAERLNTDGSIYTANLRNATATDIYILSGNGVETYTPTLTFHGFRYVEVTGNSTPLTLTSVEGLVENSLPPNPTLEFRSSSKTLNSMNELGIWGQRGYFVSIPTDCPQRDERLGWMGDAGAFWRTGTYNFDIGSFTYKFMSDITDAQLSNGSFTDISPDLLSRAEGAPGWADAGILIPYAAWLQYGDLTLVRQSWPAMQRYMDFILQSNPNHLRQHNLGANYGDWLAPDPHTPQVLIGTAYWALVARDMETMATALQKPDDVAHYAALYQAITSAYRAAYIRSDGSIVGNTQTAYAATLYAGLAPDDLISNLRRVSSMISKSTKIISPPASSARHCCCPHSPKTDTQT
jgi:alpha-L-rhamnosidase